jgi:hypothetical protein
LSTAPVVSPLSEADGAPRRPKALLSRVIRFDDPHQAERRRVEAFIEDSYASAWGSQISVHYPTLMSVQDEKGEIYAVVGFRSAAEEPLFLEQYLDAPVESALTALLGVAVGRGAVVEIGSLASNGRGATIFLFAALARHLMATGAEFAVATATDALRGIFHRAGLGSLKLATANPDRLRDHGLSWGAYYQANPEVLAGSICAACDPLDRFADETEVARAVRTRLHFRGRP